MIEVLIDPSKIEYFVLLKYTKIENDDWDINKITLMKYFEFLPLSFELFESSNFKNTDFYKFYSDLRGQKAAIDYCKKYLDLYLNILKNGYQHQSTLNENSPHIHSMSKTLVQVCLNRFGVYGLAKNGQHRLAICLHQKIQQIPANLVLVHPYAKLY
jgi:hypothetical protein